ncbi:MAG TPA: hypothetical protein V6C97_33655 [Oculatellaceae cyanobacterium]
MQINRTARNKALLALAFTGGIVSSQLSAPAADPTESSETAIQQIVNSSATPEIKAYYLLCLADGYLGNSRFSSRKEMEDYYKSPSVGPRGNWYLHGTRGEDYLLGWAESVSNDSRARNRPADADMESLGKLTVQDGLGAKQAIDNATKLLSQASNESDKLILYFAASRLAQREQDKVCYLHCSDILKKAINDAEKNSIADERQIKSASTLLNLLAFDIIPLKVPDYTADRVWKPKTVLPPFTESQFKEAEMLHLRAAKICDRLDPTNHVRRKIHRDLALWYEYLGKEGLAEKQKKVLFDLVGSTDEKILYPQSRGCGSVVWWQPKQVWAMGCGMG